METMCFNLKSGNYTVRNQEILKNKVYASIHIVQMMEAMCCYLKSGNCIVQN